MSLYNLDNNIETVAFKSALHDINEILKQHGLSCVSAGIPIPTGNSIKIQGQNQSEEKAAAERCIISLNNEQLSAFMKITAAIDIINENDRYIY